MSTASLIFRFLWVDLLLMWMCNVRLYNSVMMVEHPWNWFQYVNMTDPRRGGGEGGVCMCKHSFTNTASHHQPDSREIKSETLLHWVVNQTGFRQTLVWVIISCWHRHVMNATVWLTSTDERLSCLDPLPSGLHYLPMDQWQGGWQTPQSTEAHHC